MLNAIQGANRMGTLNGAIKLYAVLEELPVFCYNHMMYEYG